MYCFRKLVFLSFFLIFSSAQAIDIVKVNDQTEIMQYIKPGTWVFTDLDRTLIAKNYGTPYAFELNKAYTKMLKDLQDQGVPVFGLTARGSERYDYTMAQVKALGVDFSKSLKIVGITDLGGEKFSNKNSFFKSGILFSKSLSKTKKAGPKTKTKGINLNALLTEFPKKDRTIVFIDDQYQQLEAVQKDLKSDGVLLYYEFSGHPLFKGKNTPNNFPKNYKNLRAKEKVSSWGREMLRMEDKSSGATYLLQSNNSHDWMKEQVVALRLYEAFGLDVPQYRIISGKNNSMELVGFQLGGTDLQILFEDYLEKADSSRDHDLLKEHLSSTYVIDALLSHTAVIRRNEYKQIMTFPGNIVKRTDFRATLRLGRSGIVKTRNADWKMNEVVELLWFRDANRDALSAETYSDLTKNLVKTQIRSVLKSKTKILKTLRELHSALSINGYEELKAMIQNRFLYLESLI